MCVRIRSVKHMVGPSKDWGRGEKGRGKRGWMAILKGGRRKKREGGGAQDATDSRIGQDRVGGSTLGEVERNSTT